MQINHANPMTVINKENRETDLCITLVHLVF